MHHISCFLLPWAFRTLRNKIPIHRDMMTADMHKINDKWCSTMSIHEPRYMTGLDVVVVTGRTRDNSDATRMERGTETNCGKRRWVGHSEGAVHDHSAGHIIGTDCDDARVWDAAVVCTVHTHM